MSTNIYSTLEQILKSQKIKIRLNNISLKYETLIKDNWSEMNENDLYISIIKRGLKINMNQLLIYLQSSVIPKYNPLIDYFAFVKKSYKSKATNKAEFEKLCRLITLENEKERTFFERNFKLWLARSVRCAVNPQYFNKQCLVFVSSVQDVGKTTFCRWLCPDYLREYLAENINNDKDSRIILAKNFLINLDDLATLPRFELQSLKAYFTKTTINERLPYARKNTILSRTSSFIGSIDNDQFLTDTAGSSRWLCFNITNIDFSYKWHIDINRIWAYANEIHLTQEDINMTREDSLHNSERNRRYQNLSSEAETIQKYYVYGDAKNDAHFKTATDILIEISTYLPNTRISKIGVGRALNYLKFKRMKKDNIYGYYIKKMYQD